MLLWCHDLGHGTPWKLQGCWLLLHRESPHSQCIDYPEHRTTRAFLTIPSSKHQAPWGSPVHPSISRYIPPQPCCYLLFALLRSLSHCPIRLLPVFPPSRGTCPLGEHFFRSYSQQGWERSSALHKLCSELQRCPDKALPLFLCLMSMGSSASFLPSPLQKSALAAAGVISILQLAARSAASPSLRGLGLDPGRAAAQHRGFILPSPIISSEIKSGEKNWRLVEVPCLPPGHSCVLCAPS